MVEPLIQVRSESRTLVGMESEAVLVGSIAAAIGAIVGAVAFAGENPPIWGGWSLGLVAAIVVLVLGLVSGFLGYWRSRHISGQEWRLDLKPWKFIVDATSVAGVHTLIATLGTMATFFLLQLSFQGLYVDGWTSSAGIALAGGIATYLIYLSVSKIDTTKMASLLVVFMVVSTLTVMSTAQDPQWWEYHFSQLGTFDTRSSGLFNLTLMVSGLLVTTFALYLQRDIRRLTDAGVLAHAWSERVVAILFIVLGLMLAGVGAFPLDVNAFMHNACASGMAFAFGGLLISAPWVLRGMPTTFFLVTGGFLAGMVVSVILFAVTGYFNLTAFELVVFAIIFGWIATFIRFLSATANQSDARANQIKL
jgi:hypothetical membrane protein